MLGLKQWYLTKILAIAGPPLGLLAVFVPWMSVGSAGGSILLSGMDMLKIPLLAVVIIPIPVLAAAGLIFLIAGWYRITTILSGIVTGFAIGSLALIIVMVAAHQLATAFVQGTVSVLPLGPVLAIAGGILSFFGSKEVEKRETEFAKRRRTQGLMALVSGEGGLRMEAKFPWKMVIFGVTAVVTLLMFLITLTAFTNKGVASSLKPLNWLDFGIAGMLCLFGPPSFYLTYEQGRIASIEEKLPEFLRDLAESGRFGMTLSASIRTAAKGKYGALTPEIRKMAAQIAWGVSATEAIKLFGERVGTPLVKRTTGIIIKASDAGGNVSDVLTLVSVDAKEAQIAEHEKSIEMMTFVIVIYVAFFVFLTTVLILNSVFIPQMEKAAGPAPSTASAAGTGGAATSTKSLGSTTTVNKEAIPVVKQIYVGAALVHGIGDGVMAGVLTSGRISFGLRHSFIMVLIGYIGLRAMVA